MRRWLRRLAWTFVVVVAGAWLYLGLELEGFLNRVDPDALPPVSSQARALHAASFVADLHADSLLFGRDLLRRGRLGHVDLPRLREGGVALQVFGLPTKVFFGTNIDRTEAHGVDALTVAGIARLSPTAWQSPMQRALYHAARLAEFARASDGAFILIRDRQDLAHLKLARAEGEAVIGGVLAIEGAHALESDPANLQRLFDAGYRMIGMSHFFDNDYAGSSAGVEQGGLTPLGRATLAEMEALGITADLAHLSPAAVDDVLALSTRPVVVSHSGVRGTCDNARNLSDEQIRRVAAGGGVVGIGFWQVAVCGLAPVDIARAIQHVVKLVGAEHAALGSDYDGATTVGFDVSGLPEVTQALLDVGLSEAEIRLVLGENVLRVLSTTLPPGLAGRGRIALGSRAALRFRGERRVEIPLGIARLGLEEHLEHQERDPDHDPAIGHVEGRPDITAEQPEIEEVDDLAVAQAVREIADRAAEHAADRRRRQPVPRLDSPQEDQQQHDRQQPGPEEEGLTDLLRQRRQEAEGAPRIANVGQVEEARDDGQLLTVGKSVQDPLLGPLIDGEGQREDGDKNLEFQGDLGHRRRAYHEARPARHRAPARASSLVGAPWEMSRARTGWSAVAPARDPDWRPAPSSWAARDATTKLT